MPREDQVPSAQDERGLVATMGRLADGMGNLLVQHLQLARLEAAADAKALGGEVARAAVFVPFAMLGYALLCAAAAVALARVMPLEWALALVGAPNFAVGGWGLWAATRGLKARKVFERSLDELGNSAALLTREAPHGR